LNDYSKITVFTSVMSLSQFGKRAVQSSKLWNQWLLRLLNSLGLAVLPILLLGQGASAAQFIQVTYGVFARSLPISSLATYAETGDVDPDLAEYLGLLKPAQREKARQLLLTRLQLNAVQVSQFFYTPQGENLLERLGDVIRSNSTQTGFFAIRAALILAADDSQGLTLLNVLQKFPTREIRIDLARGLQMADEIDQLVSQTQQAVEGITQASAIAAIANPLPPKQPLANLQNSGPYSWQRQSLLLNDISRKRQFPVDLYLPQSKAKNLLRLKAVPVVVISHGLGADRTTFKYLAEHLASYGFAVAVPEHLGSSAKQIQNWLSGQMSQAVQPSEFIDRPLDIKFLLNDLQFRSRSSPMLKGRLDLQNVAVIGHSFGGYTALTLAGAPIDLQNLRGACQNEAETLNLSLLLQCQALQLATPAVKLQDTRIKAVIALNPFGSGLMGQSSYQKIQVPLMIIASSNDTAAPALLEQFQPFTWLTTPQKYLALMNRATHFSTSGEVAPGSEGLPIPAQAIGPNPAVSRRYLKALSIAFLKTYLMKKPEYQLYLSSAYAQSISVSPFQLSVLRSLSVDQLTQMAQTTRPNSSQ
jgi:predicted dienelactone hydrolase